MTKTQLRARYKSKREHLDQNRIDDLSLAIANMALQLPIWDAKFYHLFLPIVPLKEVNTEFLLHILQGKDKSVVLSKSNFKTQTLQHYLLEDDTVIKTNSYAIPEPQDGLEVPVSKLDVVFIPLLTFDQHGNRLGYGKGFYDRFLAGCKPEVIKVGLSFFKAESSIPTTPTDVALDYCITPEKVYTFN